MEKQTISQVLNRLPETAHKGVGILAKGFLIIAGFIVLYSLGAQASSSTTALTPQAQRVYDANRTALCESEKTLAQSKLTDYTNGLLTGTSDQVKSWAEKMKQECQGF